MRSSLGFVADLSHRLFLQGKRRSSWPGLLHRRRNDRDSRCIAPSGAISLRVRPLVLASDRHRSWVPGRCARRCSTTSWLFHRRRAAGTQRRAAGAHNAWRRASNGSGFSRGRRTCRPTIHRRRSPAPSTGAPPRRWASSSLAAAVDRRAGGTPILPPVATFGILWIGIALFPGDQRAGAERESCWRSVRSTCRVSASYSCSAPCPPCYCHRVGRGHGLRRRRGGADPSARRRRLRQRAAAADVGKSVCTVRAAADRRAAQLSCPTSGAASLLWEGHQRKGCRDRVSTCAGTVPRAASSVPRELADRLLPRGALRSKRFPCTSRLFRVCTQILNDVRALRHRLPDVRGSLCRGALAGPDRSRGGWRRVRLPQPPELQGHCRARNPREGEARDRAADFLPNGTDSAGYRAQ